MYGKPIDPSASISPRIWSFLDAFHLVGLSKNGDMQRWAVSVLRPLESRVQYELWTSLWMESSMERDAYPQHDRRFTPFWTQAGISQHLLECFLRTLQEEICVECSYHLTLYPPPLICHLLLTGSRNLRSRQKEQDSYLLTSASTRIFRSRRHRHFFLDCGTLFDLRNSLSTYTLVDVGRWLRLSSSRDT